MALSLLDNAAHPVLASRAISDRRVDDLDLACVSRVHDTPAGRPPVDEGQPPQGEAAAATEVKEPGQPLAVERRALAAAGDGHPDVGGAADLVAQLDVRIRRQEDGDVGTRPLDKGAEPSPGRRSDKAGNQRRQRG